MSQDPKSRSTSPSFRGSMALLAFGLSVLAFLIAIDRPHWFDLRPASGVAAAMSHAAERSGHAASDHGSTVGGAGSAKTS